MEDSVTESTEQPQLRKRARRHKVAQACHECRSRKIKCDGHRPVCGPCLKRFGHEADCNLRLTTGQEFAQFRKEIARLNSKVQNLEGRTSDSLGNGEVSGYQRDRMSASPSEPISPLSSVHGEGDPMVGEIPHRLPTGQTFFGTSSASSFVRQVQRALDPEHGSELPTTSTLNGTDSRPEGQSPELCESLKSDGIDLPSRSTADRLLDIYWQITHPLYPFLDQEETKERYATLWRLNPPILVQRSFLCQVYMIFAMASQLDETILPSDRAATARVYVVRARQQLTSELWEHASLQAVQNFLILGQYLQSTTRGYQCWMVVGHAIRMAQNLGLHYRETSERIESPRKRQLYRKVWHGCIMMDRIVSLTFGRPTMIDRKTASMVPLPLNQDDIHLSHEPASEGTQNIQGPMVIDFYIETLKLYEILHEILTRLYDSAEEMQDVAWSSASPLEAEKLAPLLDLDRNLTVWFDNLPDHLNTNHKQSYAPVFFRQANILYSRYLHVRILLYRPPLARFIAIQNAAQPNRAQTPKTLHEYILIRCSTLCVQAAISAVEAIDVHLPKSTASVGSLPAWWYNVLYLYTAAVVLLAATRNSIIHSEIGQGLILERFKRAMLIVRRYRVYSSTVQKSVNALEALFSRIPEQGQLHNLAESTDNVNNDYSINAPTTYTNSFQGQQTPQQQHYAWSPEQQFERNFVQPQPDEGHLSSEYSSTVVPNYTIDQPMYDQMSLNFDPTNLNMSLDINDLSWLNSLPFNL